jgi:hypothetical protein
MHRGPGVLLRRLDRGVIWDGRVRCPQPKPILVEFDILGIEGFDRTLLTKVIDFAERGGL